MSLMIGVTSRWIESGIDRLESPTAKAMGHPTRWNRSWRPQGQDWRPAASGEQSHRQDFRKGKERLFLLNPTLGLVKILASNLMSRKCRMGGSTMKLLKFYDAQRAFVDDFTGAGLQLGAEGVGFGPNGTLFVASDTNHNLLPLKESHPASISSRPRPMRLFDRRNPGTVETAVDVARRFSLFRVWVSVRV